MRRSLAFLLPLLAILPVARSARAQAPISAADREAARDLYKEGYDLQKAGKYGDALDRFRRSEQVFPAPTALLHIAECEVELVQLVEAAETYRTLVHLTLPPGSPPAFVAAQTQGAAELQQVEPRIPHLRIDVRPPNVPNLVVMLDDQPVNPALLDVARPVDPGPHKILAQAPGYERMEGMVTVEEKEPAKTVVLALKPGASGPPIVAPGVAGPGGLGLTGQPQIVYVSPPPGAVPVEAPPPPVYYRPKEAATTGSRLGLFGGLRVGGIIPAGSDISSVVGAGVDLGGEINLRFARRFFVGVVIDHGFLSTASANTVGSGVTYGTTGYDAVFGVLTNPDHFGGIFQVAGGYRVLTTSFAGISGSVNSGELGAGVGLWIPTGRYFRIVPRVDTTFGSFSSGDPASASGNSLGYAMISLDVGGYFNIDFH